MSAKVDIVHTRVLITWYFHDPIETFILLSARKTTPNIKKGKNKLSMRAIN